MALVPDRAPSRPTEYVVADGLYTMPPFGLQNNGAICWFNSVLQFMMGIAPFNQEMIDNEESLQYNQFAAMYIKALSHFLPLESLDVAEVPYADLSLALLHEMMNSLKMNGRHKILGIGQQCADEGFTTFLEQLYSLEIDNLFKCAYKQSIVCAKCSKKVSQTRDASNRINIPPTKNFHSEEERRMWQKAVSGLPFNDPRRYVIENFNTPGSLKRWILSHTTVTLDYKCPGCNEMNARVSRGETICMIREVLILKFDKLNQVDTTVYPLELEFPANDGRMLKYQLCGKICWSGHVTKQSSGGHYWAHSLRGNKWYMLNDTGCSPGNPNPERSVLMIAYQLCSAD